MRRKARLGLITTGQGPRQDYVAFHGELLRQLGVEAEIFVEYALDGLSPEELETLEPAPGEDAIHSYVRFPGRDSKRFGSGWGEAWMERGRTIPIVQSCIERLEQEHGVDATIYCCAEPYPEGVFRASKPFVMPYKVVLSYVENLVISRDHRPVIGVLTGGARQRPQQMEMWQRYTWSSDIDLHFAEMGSEPLAAAQHLATLKPDLVVWWGYGVDLAPGDSPTIVAEMQEVLGQPILLHHVAATLFVRNVLYPALDGRAYARSAYRQGNIA